MVNAVRKVLAFPQPENKSATVPKAPAVELEAREQRLQDKIFDAYSNLGYARGHTQGVIADYPALVKDFLAFSGKALWECTSLDFEAWCAHLGRERKLALSSQRKYQGVVRGFYDFVLGRTPLMAAIETQFGVRLQQVATEDNCIPHILAREISAEKTAMTFAELDHFFKTLDKSIAEAFLYNGKDRYPLLRDRALFYFLYCNELRIGESLATNLGSLRENPQLTELGLFGLTSVMRKGSKGSGKKHQMVATTNPGLPPMMEWYIDEVRPVFAAKQRSELEQDPLFFTERGDRMTYGAAYERLNKALAVAGLAGRNFSPHTLRHTGTTHEALVLSLVSLQHKLGHVHLETTMRYLHIPDEYINAEIVRVVQARIEEAQGAK